MYVPISGRRQPSGRLRLLAAALLLSCGVAGGQPTAVPVTAAEAALAPIVEEVPVSGTVTSPRLARLSTAVGGLVAEVRVDAGDRVDQGALLLRLDPALDEATLRRARAAKQQAEEELADARRRLEEARTLLPQQSIPETQVRSLEAEVRIDAAALERLEAEQQRQAAVVERHRLHAPFAGVISRKLTETGEWVEPGTPVFELVATRGLRLDFQVPQEFFSRITADTELSVQLDALGGRRFDGRIAAVVPVSDPSARTFLMRVLLDEPAPITPGMSARALLRLGTGVRGIVVPRDALLRHPDGRVTVWIVEGADGATTVSERQVSTGLSFAGRVHIRDGLKAGARVVLQGNEALQEGQAVHVQEGV